MLFSLILLMIVFAVMAYMIYDAGFAAWVLGILGGYGVAAWNGLNGGLYYIATTLASFHVWLPWAVVLLIGFFGRHIAGFIWNKTPLHRVKPSVTTTSTSYQQDVSPTPIKLVEKTPPSEETKQEPPVEAS